MCTSARKRPEHWAAQSMRWRSCFHSQTASGWPKTWHTWQRQHTTALTLNWRACAGSVSPEDCYFSMLEEYGLEYDFLELPVAALPILRNAYRLVHVVELLDDDRCTAKASMGSSSFTTAQMAAFIDGIFDRLAEMGINDPNVTQYWQEWKEVPRWKKRKS